MADFESFSAYWYSLRYLRPRQILGRLRYRISWKFYRLFPFAVRAWCDRAGRSHRPRANFSWPRNPALASDHQGGNCFRFLNETVDFGERIDWNPPDRSLLWRFHLHYFDWAESCERGLLVRQIESWIDANPPGSWPGWHPYPTSLRIVNWIRAHVSETAPPPRMVASLATQAAFLERNLELHLGGNHLLENARALLAAGLYFEGPRAAKWKSKGLNLLRQELETQVLPDGGHFERSPFYHLRMTRLVSDAIDLLAAQGCEIPPELSRAKQKMTAFQLAVRHLDGSLPLFHDSLGQDRLDRLPVLDERYSFPSTGYYILEGPQGRLIADYGAPGDCYNPAHQHAGIFSFEISSGDGRVVVDSGTETYDPGLRRERLRSTAAHNTVRVDERDQFQVWSTFRVGRRAWVSPVEERREPHYQAISAAHDGYVRLGVEHRRSIICIPDAGWLIVDDLSGRGSHRLESFIHLDAVIRLAVDSGRVCLMPLGWILLPFGLTAPLKITSDTYSPAPGALTPSQTVVLEAGPDLPCRFGYFLGGSGSRLTWDGAVWRIETPARAILVRLAQTGLDSMEVSYN